MGQKLVLAAQVVNGETLDAAVVHELEGDSLVLGTEAGANSRDAIALSSRKSLAHRWARPSAPLAKF